MEHKDYIGELYLVATPIGNLEDISLRALNILKTVNLIAAEDTRHTQQLLSHYAIQNKLLSLYKYNEQQRIQVLLKYFAEGQSVALVSDAGTPLISDPGYRLVKAAHENKVRVIPIPGACAAIAGLIASGLPTDQFVFAGFLPAKGAARKQRIIELSSEPRTIVLYESVHRIINLLTLLQEELGAERQMTIARELTKLFETIRQGSVREILEWMQQNKIQQKGEFVVVLQGHGAVKDDKADHHVLQILLQELPLKQAVALASKITQGNRKELYNLALKWKENKKENL